MISIKAYECVDIKEGCKENIVGENTCTDQLDMASGCYNIRLDNTIRYDWFWVVHPSRCVETISTKL